MTDRPAADDATSFAADEVYLEPLTAETIRRIIEKERPDGLLAGFGGQTGLTISSQLYHEGFLDRMGGSCWERPWRPSTALRPRTVQGGHGEDRQPLIPSATATEVEQALAIAEKIGYPVIVRPAFTLAARAAAWPTTPRN